MFRRILPICFLLFFCAGILSAQMTPPAEYEPPASEETAPAMESDLETRTRALSIAVSNYYELRVMAQKLGLDTEGSSEVLRQRLYEYFKVQPPLVPSGTGSVTIENSSTFEYFTLEERGDRVIRLHGPISLTIRSEDGFSHMIVADEILFNQDTNIVEARGEVTYTRTGEGREDVFSGSTIIVDLDVYSGVFIDGSYNMEPTGSLQRTLTFAFDTLVRREADLTVLQDARVTSCDEVPPHYHIRARKVWLFENGDWALSGATLYVGIVPVLWLPYFYYPSDEIIFHPAFGYRMREGSFVQTTTYILGQFSAERTETSSLSLLERDAVGDSVVQGVFVKRIQGNSESAEASGDTLMKLLLDVYASLGAYAGLQGVFVPGPEASLDFRVGIGLSRSIFLQTNGYYSPFDDSASYSSVWNESLVLGARVPFRFGIDLSYEYRKTEGDFRVSLAFKAPLYSDPYFEQDFHQRSESSSIVSSLTSKPAAASKRTSMTQSIVSSFSWNPAKEKETGAVSALSVSKLGAQLVWNSKPTSTAGLTATEKRLLSVDPARDFFYPDSVKFLDTSFSATGSLVKISSADVKEPNESEEPADDSSEAAAPTPEPPTRAYRANLDWTVSGSGLVEEKFRTATWLVPEDIDYAPLYVLTGFKGSLQLRASADVLDKALAFRTNLSLGAQDQYRPYLLDDRLAPVTVHPFRVSDYAYRATSSDASASITLSPLLASPAFASTTISYSITASLFKYRYAGLSGTGVDATPLYTSSWAAWSSEFISSHSATAALAHSVTGGIAQKLSFSANLPPLSEKYSAAYSFTQKYFKLTVQGAVARANEDDALAPSSFGASITLGASPFPVLKSELAWDFTASEPASVVSSFSYEWMRLAFIARKSKGYRFDEGLWILDGTEYFRPFEASAEFSPTFESSAGKGGAAESRSVTFDIRPKLSFTQNMIRFTDSTLLAAMEFSLSSKDGTALSLSSSSANKSAWRYFPDIFPTTSDFDPGLYGKNFFVDIFESISLWDASALRRSLFKMNSMSLKLSQDLHDWTLAASLGMSPVLFAPETGRPYYELDFFFDLSVVWKDIPELKTSVNYKEGVFTE